MSQAQKFQQLVEAAERVVIIQASNPDVDSLASALALEDLLKPLLKSVELYCSIPMPKYLQFLAGWQSVQTELADEYDLAIMVDSSSLSLLDSHRSPKEWQQRLSHKPLIVLDHHLASSEPIKADLIINDHQMVATGQLIYTLAKQLGWVVNQQAAEYLAASILSDSLGFSSQAMTDNAEPLRVMAELVDLGVNLAELNDKRLQQLQISPAQLTYKGQLLQRIEFFNEQQIAVLAIPHAEIKQFSGQYNPTTVLDEMRTVAGVKLTIGFKQYHQQQRLTRLTARLRCHNGCQIAQKLASSFGGGGHPYAAGIKWSGHELNFEDLKTRLLHKADELLETDNG